MVPNLFKFSGNKILRVRLKVFSWLTLPLSSVTSVTRVSIIMWRSVLTSRRLLVSFHPVLDIPHQLSRPLTPASHLLENRIDCIIVPTLWHTQIFSRRMILSWLYHIFEVWPDRGTLTSAIDFYFFHLLIWSLYIFASYSVSLTLLDLGIVNGIVQYTHQPTNRLTEGELSNVNQVSRYILPTKWVVRPCGRIATINQLSWDKIVWWWSSTFRFAFQMCILQIFLCL